MKPWFKKTVVLTSLALFVAFMLSSCVSTITPPEGVEDPLEVYLLEEARHVGLVLPDFNGGFVEYGYGDWDWFAENCDSWYHLFDTVLWPTRGCLGRRTVTTRDSKPYHRTASLKAIEVDRGDARRLLTDLDTSFEGKRETLVHNHRLNFDFVVSGRSFWFGYNCHDAVARWLEALGCEVSWTPVRMGLDVAP